tara:strand:+ start:733 stop:1110 length:378 start_codon:yes stop_codon:yes gene_type:complete
MAIMLALDIVWIYTVAHPAYAATVGHLLRSQITNNVVMVAVALSVYILMVSGLIVFVLPKVHGLSLIPTIFYSGLFGLIVYGVFAMTNYAILEPWTIQLMLLDTLWGFVLYSLTTLIVKYFFPDI